MSDQELLSDLDLSACDIDCVIIKQIPADRVYYKKFPFRVQFMNQSLGGFNDFFILNRCLNRWFKKDNYRYKSDIRTIYFKKIRDAETLVQKFSQSVKLHCLRPVTLRISGPVSDSHQALLEDRNSETQVFREKLWWGQYNTRIKFGNCSSGPSSDRFIQEKAVSFLEENFKPSEILIHRDYWGVQTVYLDITGNEDVFGMFKMQFPAEGSYWSPIKEIHRCILIDDK